ncbi:MAG: hypothetical protein HY558_00730 [Euryarchaeota archaeon]|nr:hypothetical protein [Euryarchaeota archaeon]
MARNGYRGDYRALQELRDSLMKVKADFAILGRLKEKPREYRRFFSKPWKQEKQELEGAARNLENLVRQFEERVFL